MKDSVTELAVLGGSPAFGEPLHVGRPNIGDRKRLLERMDDLLNRRWLSNNGPFVQDFERKLAAYSGVKHCIAMCNGTIALEIAIRACGLKDEVIVPSMTFVATAHALQWQQIKPVFCDIDRHTYNIDPSRIEDLITPRTTGIIGVHLFGRPCDTEALSHIASKHGLRLLYDAAHAFGCTHNGSPIGGFGDAEIFSFHATKFFNTFEGGAIAASDDELANRIRLMKNFGFCGYDNVVYLGINGKMTEPSAAMGLTGLESLDHFMAINRTNYERYRQALTGIRGVSLMQYSSADRSNYQYVVLEIDPAETGINRDQLIQVLHAENVLARRYFYPGCHKMEPYRSNSPDAGSMLPETERIAQRIMALPTGSSVCSGDIDTICRIVGLAIEHADRITSKL